MSAPLLTSVPRVKAFLKMDSDGDDALLQALVVRLSAWVQTRLNRDIVATAYSYRFNGNGIQSAFQFPDYPVISVAEVKFGNQVLVAERDYWFDEFTLYLLNQPFPQGRGNVSISTRAGWEVVPEDLDEAVAELVAFAYRERDRLGASSKSVGGETIVFITKSAPARILELLDNYRKVFPG